MVYIYDILLNFNTDFYEFYEWEKNDCLFHIKKIPIYKVETSFMEDLLGKKIVIDSPIVLEMTNKTEIFDNKRVKTIKYACLFTDTYRVVGVLLNDDFSVSKVSDLLLDEASDAISISKRCNLIKIAYNIVGNRKEYSFFTRSEIKIKKYLISEIKSAYRDKDLLKLEYLYFEFFKCNCDNLEKIYTDLVESLSKEITADHLKLYDLLRLCQKEAKKLPNLTN